MFYPEEVIPHEDDVFRQIHKSLFKKSEYRFPSEGHFNLTDGERGLSVNWERYCKEQDNWILIGATFRPETEVYKDYQAFRVFRFNVGWLREIEKVINVVHDPIYHEELLIGTPDNRAHSLILYNQIDEEVRRKLRNYVGTRDANIECRPDVTLLEPEIQSLQKRLKIFENLVKLKDGWSDGEGIAPNRIDLKWLANVLCNKYNRLLPLPSLNPTPEGNVWAEWSQRPWEVSLEINLGEKTAFYQALNLVSDSLDEINVDLRIQEHWDIINGKLLAIFNS